MIFLQLMSEFGLFSDINSAGINYWEKRAVAAMRQPCQGPGTLPATTNSSLAESMRSMGGRGPWVGQAQNFTFTNLPIRVP